MGRWPRSGSPPKAHAFSTALNVCLAWYSSFIGFDMITPVKYQFVCASVTPNLDSDSNMGPLWQCLHFLTMTKRASSNQHSWETQGLHLSCLLILRMPAKCLLLWRDCVCTLKNRVRGLALHQLQFPVLCLIQSLPNPCFTRRERHFHRAFSQAL